MTQEHMQEASPQREAFVLLKEKEYTLSTAESLTCGMIAEKLGSVPGISAVYAGGFVTYCDREKNSMLGVRKETLSAHGAISMETAEEMCRGCSGKAGTDCAVSATGNAGPDAQEGKAVGLVYIGVCIHGKTSVREYHFEGNREEIREQASDAALRDLCERLVEK